MKLKKIDIKVSIIKFLILFIIILYLNFLYIDLFNSEKFFYSNLIKFSSMILVFIISFMIGNNHESKKDAHFLQIGLFITITADIFLLLVNNYYVVGVLLFSIVQILYSIRYNKKDKENIISKFIFLFFILLIIYKIINTLFFKADPLIFAVLYYSISLFHSTYLAISLSKENSNLKLNTTFITIGMILFLLCDLNVALFNLFKYIDYNNRLVIFFKNITFISMWLFYLPSQLLLSLSGYRNDFLKKLF